METEETTRRGGWVAKKRLLIVIPAAAVIAIAGSVGLWAALKHSNGSGATPALPSSMTSSAKIPLYFPKHLSEFHLVAGSAALEQPTLANFTLQSTNGAQLIIIEQSRPPIMEEVTKTREFNTSIGHAYLANLNGRTAGFIVTSKTLIIINKVGSIDDQRLVDLMNSMTSVN
ncbi:MAG TPA: hypothetical protein VLH86_03885 [Patescibacteria group bacterium]|nr:hypothetical protein [Patescibacteria group bacterium]